MLHVCEVDFSLFYLFQLKCGVRQGGVLSPYLFALYIDIIVDKVKRQNIGCILHYFCYSIILYADDMLLLAPSLDALQRLILICEEELRLLDLAINVKKICLYSYWPTLPLPRRFCTSF